MWQIKYHRLVLQEDFKKLSKSDHERIFKTIHKKLGLDPMAFGKPLVNTLKGYYRLRLDPYRVVYKIDKNMIIVFVIKIGLRKDSLVYLETAKRLKLL